MKTVTILALHLGVGGVEKATVMLANLLSEKYTVELVVTYKLPEIPNFEISPNVTVRCLMPNDTSNRSEIINSIKKMNIFKLFREINTAFRVLEMKKATMITAIKACQSDIVISTRMSISFLLSKYGKSNQIKIAQEHNDHKNNYFYIRKVIKSCQNIDFLMPSSRYLTLEYTKIFNKKKTKCKYIPIPLEYIPKTTSLLNNNNIIAVGRLSKEKGFSDLINVFEKIYAQSVKLKLIIVGDGPERKKLENLVKRKDLTENIFFTGFKTKEDLKELYYRSDLYLMTSFEESFGIVLLEAASFGVPSIAFSSARGACEIINNDVTGYLIDNRSYDDMAGKVYEYFANRPKMISMGINAHIRAEGYSMDIAKEEWNKFIEEVLNNEKVHK